MSAVLMYSLWKLNTLLLFINGNNKKKVHIHTIYLVFKTGGLGVMTSQTLRDPLLHLQLLLE